jgi:hypothetical protein
VLLILYFIYYLNNYFSNIYSSRFGLLEPNIELILLTIVILIFSFFLPSEIKYVGDIFIYIYYFFYLIPVVFIGILSSHYDVGFLFRLSLFSIIPIFFIIINFPKAHFKRLKIINISVTQLVYLSFFLSAILIFSVSSNLGILLDFDFKNTILDLRQNLRESGHTWSVAVLYNAVVKICIPLMAAYAVYKKNTYMLVASLILTLIVFSMGGHRNVVAIWLLVAVMSYLTKYNFQYWFRAAFLILLTFLSTLPLFGVQYFENILLDILRRVILIPAYFPLVYADILIPGDSIFAQDVVNDGESIPFYVGSIIHGEYGARANASSVASFIPTFGVFAPLLAIILVSFLIRMLRNSFCVLDNRINKSIVLPLSVPFIWVVIDSSFVTAMLSQSLLFYILIIVFLKRDITK